MVGQYLPQINESATVCYSDRCEFSHSLFPPSKHSLCLVLYECRINIKLHNCRLESLRLMHTCKVRIWGTYVCMYQLGCIMIQNPDYNSSYCTDFEGEESHLLVIFQTKQPELVTIVNCAPHVAHLKINASLFSNDFEEQGFFLFFWIIIAIVVSEAPSHQPIDTPCWKVQGSRRRVATIAEHSSGDAGPVDEMCFILRLYIPTWKKHNV